MKSILQNIVLASLCACSLQGASADGSGAEKFNYSGEGFINGVTFVLLRLENGCHTLRIDDIHPLMIRALRSGKLYILFDPTENKSRFWSDRPHIQEIVGVQRTTYDLYSSFRDFKGAPAPKN